MRVRCVITKYITNIRDIKLNSGAIQAGESERSCERLLGMMLGPKTSALRVRGNRVEADVGLNLNPAIWEAIAGTGWRMFRDGRGWI